MNEQNPEPPPPGDIHPSTGTPLSIDTHRMALFDDRYGVGAYPRLLELLAQPCVTYAAIASQFGVTRERVRQWHRELMPTAPSGHQRQRLCRQYRHKRRLLEDPLFRAFYRHARPYLPAGRMQLLPARDGFRTREVGLDDRIIAIKMARRSPHDEGAPRYHLQRHRGAAAYLYYHLTDADYLLLPSTALSAWNAWFVDEPHSSYRQFKNTFAALHVPAPLAAGARLAAAAASTS